MLPAFLVSEQTVTKNGEAAPVALDRAAGGLVQITLGVREVVEQEALDLVIFGSADSGVTWMAKPLLHTPQKFYTGTSSYLIDLTAHPEVTHLKAHWKLTRWGRGDLHPRFAFYVFADAIAG